MEPAKQRFFLARFSINEGNNAFLFEGLVSLSGITKITTSQDGLLLLIRLESTPVEVIVDGKKFRGVLNKQEATLQAFYEIKFHKPSAAQVEFLKLRIASRGKESDWQREYPRINETEVEPEVAHPATCILHFNDDKSFSAKILNFTLNGLRIETHGPYPENLKPGDRFGIDIINSDGTIFSNISAEARNFSKLQVGEITYHSIGIRFAIRNASTRNRFREMIKNICLSIYLKIAGAA